MATMTPAQLLAEYDKAVKGNKTNRAAALKQIMDQNGIEAPKAEDPTIPVPDAPSTGEAAWRGFGQGGTFGFGDELSGLIGAGLETISGTDESFGDLYTLYRDSQREQNTAAREEHPFAYGAAEFAGGLAVPGAGTVKGSQILGNVAKNVRPAGRLALAGAGAGGLAGTGYSEGKTAGDVATDAAIGAGLGATITPIAGWGLNKGLQIGSQVAGGVRRRLAGSADEQARLRLSQALEADDYGSVDQVRAALDDLGPEGRLADLGPTTRQEAVIAAKYPGPGRKVAEDFVEARARNQQGRLAQVAREEIDPKWDDYYKFRDDLISGRKTQAAPLYDQAYQVPIRPTPEMNRISMTPAFQEAAKKAMKTIGNELDTMGARGGLQADGSINTRFADQIGRELGDMIQTAQRTGANNAARQLTQIKKAFDAEVYKQNPVLKQARGVFSGAKDLEEAADAGRDLLFGQKQYADDVERMIEQFTPGEQDAFRVGLLRGIFDKLQTAGETHDAAKRLFNSTRVQNILRSAFGDTDSFERFMNAARNESRMQLTRNKVVGGSPTAENLFAREKAVDLAEPQGVIGWMQHLFRSLGAEDIDVKQLTQDDYAQMSNYLFGEVDDATIERILTPTLTRRLSRGIGEGSAAGPLGTATTVTTTGGLM